MTSLDHRLQRWTVGHRVGVLDHVFVALSWLGSFGLVWVVAAALAAVAWRRRDVVPLVVVGVAASDLLALALKAAIDRRRPYLEFPDQHPLVRPLLDYSFPSGHAATSFAAATVFAVLRPRLAVPAYALAAAIAWSRVYVGVHYPLDVVAGAVLGVAVGAALVLGARALARWRLGPPAGSSRSGLARGA